MNVDNALDILTLEQAVKILKRPALPDPYSDHPNENAIRWLTDVIEWMKTEEA